MNCVKLVGCVTKSGDMNRLRIKQGKAQRQESTETNTAKKKEKLDFSTTRKRTKNVAMSFLTSGGLRRGSNYLKEEEARRLQCNGPQSTKTGGGSKRRPVEKVKPKTFVVKRSKEAAKERKKRDRERKKRAKLEEEQQEKVQAENKKAGVREIGKTRGTGKTGEIGRTKGTGRKKKRRQKEKQVPVEKKASERKRASWGATVKPHKKSGKTYLIGRRRPKPNKEAPDQRKDQPKKGQRDAAQKCGGGGVELNATGPRPGSTLDFVRPNTLVKKKRKWATGTTLHHSIRPLASSSKGGTLGISDTAPNGGGSETRRNRSGGGGGVRDSWSLVRVVRPGSGGGAIAAKEYADSRRATLPPIPPLYGNHKAMDEVLRYMLPCHPEAPLRLLLTGPSGCGKSWLLDLVVQRWQHLTSVRHTINNENFEELTEGDLPFPTDSQLLVALDVDELSPKSLKKLESMLKRPWVENRDKLSPKSLKKLERKLCRAQFLLTARNVYESRDQYFLRKISSKRLYPCNNRKALIKFVGHLKLKPPLHHSDVLKVCAQSGGDLRQLGIMARYVSESNGSGTKGGASSSNSAAGWTAEREDDIWTQARTFLKAKNEKPVPEISSLMAYISILDNVERIEDVAMVTERFSFAEIMERHWSKSEHLKSMHGVTLIKDQVQWPHQLIAAQKQYGVSGAFMKRARRFFSVWGYMSQSSKHMDQIRDFGNFWTTYRPTLPDAEFHRILRQAGENLEHFIPDLMQILFPAYSTTDY